MKVSNSRQIKHNIKAHDKIYDEYEEKHGEIFNPIEQQRLRKKLEQAIKGIKTDSSDMIALDYGCGSGNLTKHLTDLGIHTVAADISKKFLGLVAKRYSHTGKVDILEIDGQSLSNVENDKFDLIAAYSVLHHVLDYLGVIKELIRVLKPGGVVYIDHEASDSYWNKDTQYLEFIRLARPNPPKKWKKYLRLANYLVKLRRIIHPRYMTEGDIHFFPDDHIEWNKVEDLLRTQGCEIVLREDYLLYRRGYPIDIYQEYKNKCIDMCLLIARKKTFTEIPQLVEDF